MIPCVNGNIPKVMPGSAAVRPSYMLQDGQNHSVEGTNTRWCITYCKSEPQMAAWSPIE